MRRLSFVLNGLDAAGDPSATAVAATPDGPVTRTLGLRGDELVLTVAAADWPDGGPVDWDLARPMSVTFGRLDDGVDPDELVTLGGYYLRSVTPIGRGEPHPNPGGSGGVSHHLRRLVLATAPRLWTDGRGGRLTVGTLNPVDADGVPDPADDAYTVHSDLVTACLGALGVTPVFIEPSIDDIDPPGPLDWGNASAAEELEALLDRVGYGAAFLNSGAGVSVYRLPKAGEPLALPTSPTHPVDFYEMASGPAQRATRIVVTSGRTRRTVVRRFAGTDIDFVAYDDRTGRWLTQTEWASAYATEIGPNDLASFQAGPPADPAKRREFARLFGAVRIKPPLFETVRRIVTLPGAAFDGELNRLEAGQAVVEAFACVPTGDSTFRNVPESGSAFARFAGCRVDPVHGVVVLPDDVVFVRMNPGPAGNHASAAAITTAQFFVTYAYESDEGAVLDDYFVRVYDASVVDDEVVLTEQNDPAEVEAALSDPTAVKLDAPFLRVVAERTDTDTEATDLNDAALAAIAEQLALARAAGDLVQSGTVTLEGLLDVWAPGDILGAVSAVTWDLTGVRTVLSINEHDTPDSVLDDLARQANRSYQAGLSRYARAGSSAALANVRSGEAPGAPQVAGVGG